MDQNTIEVIENCARGSHSRSMNFPQIVGQLLEAGVSRYHVDILRAETTYYLRDDSSHIVPLTVPGQPVAQEFQAHEVAAAVLASQTQGQTFPEFLHRVVFAGCIGYFAYLDGQRVVYMGRNGDSHTEYFPGAPRPD